MSEEKPSQDKSKKTKKKGNCNALFNLLCPHDIVNRRDYYGKWNRKEVKL